MGPTSANGMVRQFSSPATPAAPIKHYTDCCVAHSTSALGHERLGRAGSGSGHVRFSNRPFRVKHFQTIRRCSVDVASLIGRSGSSTFRLSAAAVSMSLTGSRFFSNRPFRVKHFQTIRRCSVDVAHGLALLFGIGAKALPLWDSRMRWSNLCSGLAVRRNGRSKRTCELTSSIVPRGTSSTARWSSSFLLLDLIL